MSLPQPTRALLGVLTGLTLLGTACNNEPAQLPVYSVRGKVLFKGKPITPATLVFHPQGGSRVYRPVGKTKPNGTFELTTYSENDGAPAGEYVITVTWMPAVPKPNGESEPGPNLLPERYGKPDSSGLRAKIVAGDNELPTFELVE
jgi:hypothetical protein